MRRTLLLRPLRRWRRWSFSGARGGSQSDDGQIPETWHAIRYDPTIMRRTLIALIAIVLGLPNLQPCCCGLFGALTARSAVAASTQPTASCCEQPPTATVADVQIAHGCSCAKSDATPRDGAPSPDNSRERGRADNSLTVAQTPIPFTARQANAIASCGRMVDRERTLQEHTPLLILLCEFRI